LLQIKIISIARVFSYKNKGVFRHFHLYTILLSTLYHYQQTVVNLNFLQKCNNIAKVYTKTQKKEQAKVLKLSLALFSIVLFFAIYRTLARFLKCIRPPYYQSLGGLYSSNGTDPIQPLFQRRLYTYFGQIPKTLQYKC
jgi:hypothetical protein